MTEDDAKATNLLPYFVNYPFWSDGLSKSRFISLPPTGTIDFEGTKTPNFPVGTVLIKNFFLTGANGRPFPIETRLTHREATTWSAFTYRWNSEGTDAMLVQTPEYVPISLGLSSFDWPLLSRTQCDKCHVQAQGYALGLSLEQLSRPIQYDDGVAEQVQAWVDAGFATLTGNRPAAFQAPSQTENDLTKQARTYLEVNCASCHQPNGPGDAEIDLRYTTSFARMGLCNVVTDRDTLDTPNGVLLVPGSPEDSVLYRRMNRRDDKQMPPIGSSVVDREGVSIIRRWIESLETCPP